MRIWAGILLQPDILKCKNNRAQKMKTKSVQTLGLSRPLDSEIFWKDHILLTSVPGQDEESHSLEGEARLVLGLGRPLPGRSKHSHLGAEDERCSWQSIRK